MVALDVEIPSTVMEPNMHVVLPPPIAWKAQVGEPAVKTRSLRISRPLCQHHAQPSPDVVNVTVLNSMSAKLVNMKSMLPARLFKGCHA